LKSRPFNAILLHLKDEIFLSSEPSTIRGKRDGNETALSHQPKLDEEERIMGFGSTEQIVGTKGSPCPICRQLREYRVVKTTRNSWGSSGEKTDSVEEVCVNPKCSLHYGK